MKQFPTILQTHLDSGTTTLARCWRLTRNDGVVFGFYPRQNFVHIDIGRARQWGDPSPSRATRSDRTTRFADEPPRPRETLVESRTMKGGGAAGVATIGAAGIEVVQQAVTDTQSTLQPLIPYLVTLRWAFIAVALSRSTRIRLPSETRAAR